MTNIKALSLSTIFAIILTVVLTVWSELSKSFKDILAGITGHHWVTKGVFAFAAFLILYFIFGKISDKNLNVWAEVKKVVWTAVLGILVISGFFIWHFLK